MPFVKSNKNGFVDAEAIAEAVERKNMRFVPIKTDDQLDLQAQDQWVETGSLPSDLTVEDKKGARHGRTRPLCSYPTWPAYNGSGDPKLSQNFHCAQ